MHDPILRRPPPSRQDGVRAADTESARLAASIGAALARAGRPIGLVDVGLAATAIVHHRTLVTGNTTHFDFVRAAGFELPLENWREPA